MILPALVLGLLTVSPARCAEPAPTKTPAAAAALLSESDLSGKTLQELWLMRNEVFARHGRPFKTYELHSYFMGKGYKPKKDYSEASLSPVERKNVALLERLEKELAKRDYITENGKEKVALGNVLNKFQFPAFNEAQSGLLAANGFLVLPTKSKQLFNILEQNDYSGAPNLVTTDVILQVYHEFFDASLRRLEAGRLSQTLKELCQRMLGESSALYSQTKDPALKEAARRNMAYFSVPLYFLQGQDAGAVAPEVKALVLEEAARCEKHQGLDSPLILKSDPALRVDYSQFTPRGHYTRSKELTAYFQAMMWFGTYGLPINDDTGLAQSLLIAYQLQNMRSREKPLIELWRAVYEPTAFYAGLSDELGPEQYLKALPQAFAGAGWGQFHDPARLADMRQKLAKAAEELAQIDQLRSLAPGSAQKLVLFKFMGQRYIPDSDIFTRLTNMSRPMPKALDVMAGLGSELAADLMQDRYKDTWAQWPAYPEELKKTQALFAGLKPEDWRQNLYYGWLWTLKPLLVSRLSAPYPFFMRSEAYPAKSLQTVLGSWTELRHDTILYAKQSGAFECGGGDEDLRLTWIPDPPKGYVEPNLEFYGRLKDLLKQNKQGLEKYGLPDGDMKSIFDRLTDTISFLEAVSTKELAGLPLTLGEYEQIRRFGGLLQSLTKSIGDMAMEGPLDDDKQRAALVADVHTRTGQDEALEEAVGDAAEIYAVVELEGRLKLTRGAAFTHYEFTRPLSQRLTDEQWQAMLDAGKAPPRDSWTDAFCNDTAVEQPKPAYVDDDVVRERIGKDSGWKTLDYDTGS
ncbi:MAG: DUF3160 domain-containing protein [Elusimicrobia bacterium]|nr:DUF3160 domain-containing protein [Elusimicrobiota bacterium]